MTPEEIKKLIEHSQQLECRVVGLLRDNEYLTWLKDNNARNAVEAETQRDSLKADVEKYKTAWKDASDLQLVRGIERDRALERVQKLEKAIQKFKKSFDRGFPNSLDAIQARDELFEALAQDDKEAGG